MQEQITLLDAGLVGLVVAATEAVKRLVWVPARFVPVIPILVGWILAIPAVIVARGRVPPLAVFVAQVFLEGLKIAAVAMAAFKITHTTIKGGK
ncbi:MAG: hypothetical protein ACM3ZC_13565 [Bacteroidota bacterium]